MERDLFEADRDLRVDLTGRGRLVLHLHDGDRHSAVGLEGQASGDHLVENDTDGVNVRLVVGHLASRLFRRDVVDRADGGFRHGAGLATGEPGDTEVRDLDGPVFQQHDVLGLDVPVDDALVVGMLKRPENLGREVDRFLPGDDALLLDIFFQRDAFHVLHDDVLEFIAQRDIVDLDDPVDGSGLDHLAV